MLFYSAGPYSSEDPREIEENIKTARRWAIRLWEAGHTVICPHLNTMHFEKDCKCHYEDYMRGDFQMIARCDAIFMLPGWEKSQGARREMEYAKSLGMPVFFSRDYIATAPRLHPVEISSPDQVQAFAEILGQMHRVHLDKNHDYSPGNVLGPGEQGLATRIWDKAIRLMNLTGFKVYMRTNDHPKTLIGKINRFLSGRIVIVDGFEYVEPRKPKNESINDTLIDAAVYPIIHRLFRMDKWGH